MKHEIEFITISHQLTQQERNELGPIIAHLNQELLNKELEKKAVMSNYKHQIDAIKEEFNANCDKLNSGHEKREVRARLLKNYKTFEREWYSVETFDLVKTEPFEKSDYQRDIDDNGEEMPFGKATDPTPEPEGTAETNPGVYAHLIRELNYWREKLASVPQSDDPDDQIDQGLAITAKITALETTLKAMEPDGTPETSKEESSDGDQDSGSSDQDSEGESGPRQPYKD